MGLTTRPSAPPSATPPAPSEAAATEPRARLPGILATALLTLFTGFWAFWSFTEFYYEGWDAPSPLPLAYLLPAAIAASLGAATLAWPRAMGAVIIALSLLFYGWAITMNLQRWGFNWPLVLGWAAMASLTLLGGALFIVDGRARARRPAAAAPAAAPPWWRRRLRWLCVLGAPAAIALSITAEELPRNLTRHDDGDRGARLIEGDGVRLIWAPAGPGWNWQQPWGGYPSWNSLALYGAAPVGLDPTKGLDGRLATADDMARTGLCAHLNADGTALLAEPIHLWRMPTADELVRSLGRRGASAGCTWTGEAGAAACEQSPDKGTPLWDPPAQPIYMWTSERSAADAWFVNYQGFVGYQPKRFGNPRHGYRCVKAAERG